MSILQTVKVLKAAAILLIAFGVMVAAAAVPVLSYPTLFLLDLALWPLDGAQSLAASETRLLCAVGGGMLTGWGALIFLVADRLYPIDPVQARQLILISICSWFVVDSAGSLAAGAPVNAVLNVGFLLLFLVPLLKAPSGQAQT